MVLYNKPVVLWIELIVCGIRFVKLASLSKNTSKHKYAHYLVSTINIIQRQYVT